MKDVHFAAQLRDGRETYSLGLVWESLSAESLLAPVMELAADRTLGIRPGSPYFGFELCPDGLLKTPTTSVALFAADRNLVADFEPFITYSTKVAPLGIDHSVELNRIKSLIPSSALMLVSSPPEPGVTHALANSLLGVASERSEFAAVITVNRFDTYQTSRGDWRELAD